MPCALGPTLRHSARPVSRGPPEPLCGKTQAVSSKREEGVYGLGEGVLQAARTSKREEAAEQARVASPHVEPRSQLP